MTNDLDFPQILAHTKANGPSIILLRGQPLTPELRGSLVCQILEQLESELVAGAIISADCGGSVRVRVLPIS